MSGKGVNEMKKFLTVLLASVLIASMSSLVVCAAGSSSVSGNRVEQKSEPAPDKNEQRIEEEKDLPVSSFDNVSVPQDFKNVGSIDYNLSAITTTEGFVSAIKKIDKAQQGTVNAASGILNIYSNAPFAFNAESINAINGHDVHYFFKCNGHMYDVLYGKIDLSKTPVTFDEKNKYMGPLELARQLGGKVTVIK